MADNSLDLLTQTKEKMKSYWTRPGGKVGVILAWCLFAFIGYHIYIDLYPKLMELFDDTTELAWGLTKATIAMGVSAFVVGGAIFALSSAKFRYGITKVWEAWFINSWLQLFIKTNPKLIAKGKIEDFKQERERFSDKIDEISGELENTKKEIGNIQKEIKGTNATIAVARTPQEADVYVHKLGLITEWYNKLTPLKQGLEMALTRCNDIYEQSGFTLMKMENTFKYTTMMYDSTNKTRSALRSALSMFSGDSAAAQLGDEAMMYMESTISANIGAMRQDMRKLDDYKNSYDLEKRVFNAQSLDIIKDLNPNLYKQMSIDDHSLSEQANVKVAQTIPITGSTIDSPTNDLLKW